MQIKKAKMEITCIGDNGEDFTTTFEGEVNCLICGTLNGSEKVDTYDQLLRGLRMDPLKMSFEMELYGVKSINHS